MNIRSLMLTVFFLAAPLLAQTPPQIGGGICSSATLTGSYSLTLTGRDVSSSVTFSKVLLGIGTATFDGLSDVTFKLTDNSNSSSGVGQTLSGTYSLEADCTGTLSLTGGDIASFALQVYAIGADFLITGQDGTYAYTGSGNSLPSTCNASMLSGVYSFNGNGYALASGSVTGVNNISGLIQFDGKSAVSLTWYLAASTGIVTTVTTSGTYTVMPSCVANATITDSSNNTYSLVFTVTNAGGSNFILGGAGSALLFTGSGRTL